MHGFAEVTHMHIDQATDIANRFITLLEPSCVRIVIAGSIRRGKTEVKDIELVALPIKHMLAEAFDLFGSTEQRESNLLIECVEELIASGTLKLDLVVRRNGAKYKRFMNEGIICDLFIVEPMNYGNILAIRTGNAEFSRALVTPRRQGGLMPGNMRQKNGYLWHGDELIACPTEEKFFEALGIPFVEPACRTAEIVPAFHKRGT